MVNKAHYIIFHPEHQRQMEVVTAIASDSLTGAKREWQGKIWIDAFGEKNQDPYVLGEEWLYSYCHATQLRRKPNGRTGFVTNGSTLLFCSGDAANEQLLQVDTIFTVHQRYEWKKHNGRLILPPYFDSHFENMDSLTWRDHLRWPYPPYGHHGNSVKYTYTAASDSSYLPLYQGQRVSIPFSSFTNALSKKITQKVYGKRPVPLSEPEKRQIMQRIHEQTDTFVWAIKFMHKEIPV